MYGMEIIFGLAFAGLAGFMFTRDDDDDDEPESGNEAPSENPDDGGQDPEISNTPSEGDDVIDETSPLYIENLKTVTAPNGEERQYVDFKEDLALLGGDDFLDLGDDGIAYITVDLGDGNDTIELNGANAATIEGGAGDDVFEVGCISFTEVHGGSGDDIFIGTPTEGGDINGGDGDDTIRVYPADAADRLTALGTEGLGGLTGGEGNDTFEYTLELVSPDRAGTFYATTADGETLITNDLWAQVNYISDFEPGTDVLTIDPTSLTEGYEYQGHEIRYEEYGSTRFAIVMHYTIPDYPDQNLQVELPLITKGAPLTEADFQIKELPAQV